MPRHLHTPTSKPFIRTHLRLDPSSSLPHSASMPRTSKSFQRRVLYTSRARGGLSVYSSAPSTRAHSITRSLRRALVKVFLKDSPLDVLLLDTRELDHVMSATKPKTKDADIKQTKVPHWPRLGRGLLYSWSWSTALIGLELSSITQESKSGHFANLRREAISMPPQSISRHCFPGAWYLGKG